MTTFLIVHTAADGRVNWTFGTDQTTGGASPLLVQAWTATEAVEKVLERIANRVSRNYAAEVSPGLTARSCVVTW